jgi:hypothetical protein
MIGTSDVTRLARWKCALAGGIVATVLAPLFPISLATGGGIAGYLRRGDTQEGVVVGGLAGVTSAAIVVGTALALSSVLGTAVPLASRAGTSTPHQLWLLVMVGLFVPSVFAILGAVGGALGVHVLDESDRPPAEPTS